MASLFEQLKEYAKCYGGNGDCKKCFGDWDCGGSCHDNAKMLLQKLDIVEVVRCKDCKHWIYWADSKTCSCKIHHIRTMKDDFCSYGERRDT